jgi:DNA-binding NtrC family response regulator
MPANQILIVDDEIGIRELLCEILQDEGYRVQLAENANEARALRNRARPDLVLLDIWMPDTDGITVLKEWASGGQLTMPVVMMSGHGTIETAVEATRIGAFDFLEKPIALQKLLSTVGRALRHGETKAVSIFPVINLGKASIVSEIKKRIEQIANLTSPVLFTGEPGCGHEFYAKMLQQANASWVTVESGQQLTEDPIDLLQQARYGTLYFSEIADFNKAEQKGLLFLLGQAEKHNVRVVCATAKRLPVLVDEEVFDARLFQALSMLVIELPALRQHAEDIPEIANSMLMQCIEDKQAPLRHFSTAALNALRNADWPGNLMQLNSLIKNLAFTNLTEEISADDVNHALEHFDSGVTQSESQALLLDVPLREARDSFEKLYFAYHMRKEKGNMSKVAEKVGLERTHLYRKLKQLNIR